MTNFTTTVGGNITSYVLKNLEQQQEYIIQVAASNSIGMGPFSTESVGVTSNGGVGEPEGPFYQMVWFIAVITIVILVLIVAIVIFVIVIKYKRTHRPMARKYHGEIKDNMGMLLLNTLCTCARGKVIGSICLSAKNSDLEI